MRRPGPTNARAAPQAGYSCEPSVLGPQLTLWLRSSVGVAVSSGAVTQWSDLSSYGNHFTQGTQAFQPVYAATNGNFNGQPSITPVADTANLASGASIAMRHIIAVANHPSTLFGDFHTIIFGGGDAGMMGSSGSGDWRSSGLAAATRHRDGSRTDAALDAPNRAHIFELLLNAQKVATTWRVGADTGDVNRQWTGGIVEVIASREIIPDRILRGLRQMLRARYGTP
jgi:hypothetical protein